MILTTSATDAMFVTLAANLWNDKDVISFLKQAAEMTNLSITKKNDLIRKKNGLIRGEIGLSLRIGVLL